GRPSSPGRRGRSCCGGMEPRYPTASRLSDGKLFRIERTVLLQVHTLENRRLENFLERHKAYYAYTGEIEIDRFLREILQKANEFVASAGGAVHLSEPTATH